MLKSLVVLVVGMLAQPLVLASDSTRLVVADGHRSSVSSVSFNSTGEQFVSAGVDKSVRVWRRDGALIGKLPAVSGSIFAVAMQPGDNRVLLSIAGEGIASQRLDSGAITPYSTGHPSLSARAPASNRAATLNNDKVLSVWDLSKNVAVWTRKFKRDTPDYLAYSTDEKRLVVGYSSSGKIEVLDAAIGGRLRRPKRTAENLRAMDIGGADNWLVSVTRERVVRGWSQASGKPEWSMTLEKLSKSGFFSDSIVAVHPTRSLVAVAAGEIGSRTRIWVLDLESGAVVSELDCCRSDSSAMAFSADGSDLLVAGDSGAIAAFEVASGARSRVFKAAGPGISSAAISPNGARVYVSGSDGRVWAFDTESGQVAYTLEKMERPLALSGDGNVLVTGSLQSREETRVDARRAGDGKIQHSMFYGRRVMSITTNYDGTRVAAGYDDGMVWFWTPHQEKFQGSDYARIGSVVSLTMSPDASAAFSGGTNGLLFRYQTDTGKLVDSLDRGAVVPFTGLFTEDPQRVIVLGLRGNLGFFKLGEKTPTVVVEAGANAAVVSANGERVVTSGEGGIEIRSSRDGATEVKLTGSQGGGPPMALSADGRWLIDTNASRHARLWNLQSGALVAVLALLPAQEWAWFSPSRLRYTASDGADAYLALSIESAPYQFTPVGAWATELRADHLANALAAAPVLLPQ